MGSTVGAKQHWVPLSEKENLKRESWELAERDFQAWRVNDCKSEVDINIFKGGAAMEKVLVSYKK